MGGEAPTSGAEATQLAQLAPQRADLAPQLQGAGHVAEGHLDAGEVHRLRQVVGDAPAQGVDRGLDARASGDQDDLGGRCGLEGRRGGRARCRPAGEGRRAGCRADSRRAPRGPASGCEALVHGEALALDELGEPRQEARVVVDDQCARRRVRCQARLARALSGHRRDHGEQVGRVHGLRDVVLESGQERAPTVCGPGVGRQRRRRDQAAAARAAADAPDGSGRGRPLRAWRCRSAGCRVAGEARDRRPPVRRPRS